MSKICIKKVRTTITVEEVLLQHIKIALVSQRAEGNGENLGDFVEDALVNALEKKGDFSIRERLERLRLNKTLGGKNEKSCN